MKNEKKLILLVEDESITALAEKKMLEKNGYDVILAKNGAQSIEMASSNNVDLILMDIELDGDFDGIKAAKEILLVKNVPIVFLTAHVEREMVEKVRNVTRYGYALKYSGEYVLLSSIEMVLNLYESHEKTRESEENYRRLVEDINDVIFSINERGVFSYVSPRIEHFTDYTPEEIIGKTFHEFIVKEVADNSNQFKVLAAGGSFFEEYKWIKKNGEIVWFKSSISPVFQFGEFRGFKGLLTDITFAKKNEEAKKALYLEKEKLLNELNCLYNISKILEDNRDSLDEILENIVHIIPEALSYPDCSLVVISYKGKEYLSSKKINPDVVMEREIVVGGIIQGVITIGYRSVVVDSKRVWFDEKDTVFLDTVTERIEKIIELSSARDELRNLEREIIDISERERQEIGHDLHDSLGQILTGVSFMLKTVQNQLEGSSTVLINRVNEISDLVGEATQVCRRITRGLPLVTIQHNTLLLALDQLSISTRDIFNINCEVESFGTVDIKDDFVSSQLFRITQEAVNNAVKHSGAKNIYITLKCSSGILLAVRDDGCGAGSNKRDSGMGLGIMKYRADLINGEFSAQGGDVCGFMVSVKIP